MTGLVGVPHAAGLGGNRRGDASGEDEQEDECSGEDAAGADRRETVVGVLVDHGGYTVAHTVRSITLGTRAGLDCFSIVIPRKTVPVGDERSGLRGTTP